MRYDFKLITADEVRDLIERILTQVNAEFEPGDDGEEYRIDDPFEQQSEIRMDAARAATRYACTAAAVLEEPSLVPDLLKLVRIVDADFGFEHEDIYQIGRALGTIVSTGKVSPKLVESMARLPKATFRLHIARAFCGADEHQRKLLMRLGRDVDVHVRAAAREQLGEHGPWWLGIFYRDPLPRLPADVDEEAIRESFDGLVAVADAGYGGFKGATDRIVEHLRALPAALALEVLEAWYSNLEMVHFFGHEPITHLLTLEGHEPVLERMFRRWKHSSASWALDETLEKAAAPLSGPQREALARRLLELALREARKGEEDAIGFMSVAWFAVKALTRIWPAELDPAPILEAISSLGAEESREGLARDLFGVIEKLDPAHVPWGRLVDIIVDDFPGPWGQLQHSILRRLETAPREVFEPLARRLLVSGDDGRARWALERVISLADRADGPVLEPWLEDRRCRELLFGSATLLKEHLDELRALVVDGACTLEEAGKILHQVASTYGEILPGFPLLVAEMLTREFSTEVKIQPDVAPEQAITAEEWAAWRGMRDAARDDDATWARGLGLLPPLPWCAEDEAFVDEACRRFDAGDAAFSPRALVGPLYARRHPEDIERLRRIAAGVKTPMERNVVLGLLEQIDEALAVDVEPRTSVAATLEWMDRDD